MRYLKKDSAPSAELFKPSIAPLALFAVLLLGLPLVAHSLPLLGLFSDFFQAGSLVFGGGHVVLPLLQNIVGDQLSQDAFLTATPLHKLYRGQCSPLQLLLVMSFRIRQF